MRWYLYPVRAGSRRGGCTGGCSRSPGRSRRRGRSRGRRRRRGSPPARSTPACCSRRRARRRRRRSGSRRARRPRRRDAGRRRAGRGCRRRSSGSPTPAAARPRRGNSRTRRARCRSGAGRSAARARGRPARPARGTPPVAVAERQEHVGRVAGDDLEPARVLEPPQGGDDVALVPAKRGAGDVEAVAVHPRQRLNGPVPVRVLDLAIPQLHEAIELARVAVEQEGIAHHGRQRRRERERQSEVDAVPLEALEDVDEGDVRLGHRLEEPLFLEEVLVLGMTDVRQVRVEHQREISPGHRPASPRTLPGPPSGHALAPPSSLAPPCCRSLPPMNSLAPIHRVSLEPRATTSLAPRATTSLAPR